MRPFFLGFLILAATFFIQCGRDLESREAEAMTGPEAMARHCKQIPLCVRHCLPSGKPKPTN